MQQLHLVGLTTDLDSIVCSVRKGAKSGSFMLPLDERLLQVIAEAVSQRNADGVEIEVPAALQPPSASAPRRQSNLSPREIQDRLRAGRSMEDIAAEAGVGEEWVARFSAPVEAERSQVVGRARRLTYYRARRGDSGEPLGMAVRWNLADRGVRLANDEFDAAWSAYQLADTAWMVTFRYEARKREHEAEWEVDLATNELLSRNRMATELGYVEPGRRRRAMASLQPVASTSRARVQSVATGAADAGDASDGVVEGGAARPAGRSASAARSGPSPAAARPAKKPAGRKVARPAGRPAAKKAVSRKGPVKKASAKKAVSRKGPVKKGPSKKTVPSKKAVAKKRTARSTAARPTKKSTAAKKAVAKRATGRTSKPAAKRQAKKAASRPTRRTGRGVPPGRSMPAPVAVVDDRPVPNELGRRRMQMVSGNVPPRPATRGGGRARPTPSMAGVRIAAARSGDVAAAPRPQRSSRPEVAPATVEEIVAPEPGLDVSDSEAAAEARRAERRRARAARGTIAAATPALPPAVGADDDEGVVRIRANRATPPRGDAELVLPADRLPLRPAQPAALPRKRRFNRTGR